MHVLALALLLAADPAPATDFYADEPPPSKPSRVGDARYGGGAMMLADVNGTAATAEGGVELRPWGPVALRVTIGGTARFTWGNVYVAPEAVYRFTPRESRFSPYVAAGLHAGVMNVRDEALAGGEHDDLAASSAALQPRINGDSEVKPPGDYAPGGTPLKFSVGPQLTGGVRIRTIGNMGLDLGLRYSLLRWKGDVFQGIGAVLTVCAPN